MSYAGLGLGWLFCSRSSRHIAADQLRKSNDASKPWPRKSKCMCRRSDVRMAMNGSLCICVTVLGFYSFSCATSALIHLSTPNNATPKWGSLRKILPAHHIPSPMHPRSHTEGLWCLSAKWQRSRPGVSRVASRWLRRGFHTELCDTFLTMLDIAKFGE